MITAHKLSYSIDYLSALELGFGHYISCGSQWTTGNNLARFGMFRQCFVSQGWISSNPHCCMGIIYESENSTATTHAHKDHSMTIDIIPYSTVRYNIYGMTLY